FADGRGVGGDASASGRADGASRAADPARDSGKRSHSQGRTSPSTRSRRRVRALGEAAGLRGLCGAKGVPGTAAGTHTRRPGSGAGELWSVAAGRKAATRGAGRCGGRVVHAKLWARGRECFGGLRDREEQREPAVRGRQQQSVAGVVRTTLRGSEPGGADDRWHPLWGPSAGGSAGHRRRRGKTRFGSV